MGMGSYQNVCFIVAAKHCGLSPLSFCSMMSVEKVPTVVAAVDWSANVEDDSAWPGQSQDGWSHWSSGLSLNTVMPEYHVLIGCLNNCCILIGWKSPSWHPCIVRCGKLCARKIDNHWVTIIWGVGRGYLVTIGKHSPDIRHQWQSHILTYWLSLTIWSHSTNKDNILQAHLLIR